MVDCPARCGGSGHRVVVLEMTLGSRPFGYGLWARIASLGLEP
jgi:hypothetical protein